MTRLDYYQLQGFENIYLEDSYVLDIRDGHSTIEFSIEAVLTEGHSQYSPPLVGEQYKYMKARILFSNVTQTVWLKKSMTPSIDADGSVDYGNIDVFYFEDGHYYLEGNWGEVNIVSSPPVIELDIG